MICVYMSKHDINGESLCSIDFGMINITPHDLMALAEQLMPPVLEFGPPASFPTTGA